MRKHINRPEQLRLELRWDYLKWVFGAGEELDLYEVTTRTLLGEPPLTIEANPILEECSNCRRDQ